MNNDQAVPEKENNAEIIYVAFELSRKNWKLGFSDGKTPQIRQITIGAGDLQACGKEIAKAKQRFGMSGCARVRSCYEAGREGFWLQALVNKVVFEG
jgi:transposase